MSTLSILITGSNQGLGYETARQLSKHAHIRIFISGRDASRVEEALAKIKAEDGCVAIIESVVLDVGDDTSIQAAVQDMKGKLGGAALDVLVNNGAINPDQFDPNLRDMFRRVFEINTFGTAVATDVFLPLLKKSKTEGGSRIINLSSGLASIGLLSDPKGPMTGSGYPIVYSASKSAVNSLTCTLAMRNPDIHVVCIDPGYNATSMTKYAGTMDPKDGVQVILTHVLGKVGKSPGFYSNDGEVPW